VNRNGEAALPYYGFISALAEDPIEKKPLYHYRPGSSILSLGFAGCNLRCPFCQNWHISQAAASEIPGRILKAEAVAETARRRGCRQIAYTYSEPLVHIEYLLECMTLCREAGIANVLVSSGCVNAEAAKEILALTDAANIDLKCFSEETYAKVLGGDLHTVLRFLETAAEAGVHLEVTTLVVPGLNDGEAELEKCAAFIAGLSEKGDIPWHLSAYHPDYRWDAPPTNPDVLAETARRVRQKLAYVYTGNVAGEQNDTLCQSCGAVLIRRRGYRIDAVGLAMKADRYCCVRCGAAAPVRG
jgi:pyruvate formate lyase activating enzyme